MTKEAKPDAWMPLYIGDWDGDTGHLDCEQDGAYGRLIRRYWRTGPLPDDDTVLARIIRMDVRKWRKIRSVLAQFFVVSNGLWKHKRADAELEKWAAKKVKAVERAKLAAGARWNNCDATSNATSIQQALLEECPSSSSREVRAQEGALTLSDGKNDFSGPKEVRDAFCAQLGEAWCRSYLDRCAWQDVPERALTPATRQAASKLRGEARKVLESLGIALQERAA